MYPALEDVMYQQYNRTVSSRTAVPGRELISTTWPHPVTLNSMTLFQDAVKLEYDGRHALLRKGNPEEKFLHRPF